MADERPLLPHIASEFLAWLWYTSEAEMGSVDLGAEVGRIDVWVDDRLAFRLPGDERARAVLTGENPAASLEARAALAGGKLLRELRLGLRREDREYSVTLRGALLDIQGARLPALSSGLSDEAVFERMALFDELRFLLAALLHRFASERCSPAWRDRVLPAMRSWVAGGVG